MNEAPAAAPIDNTPAAAPVAAPAGNPTHVTLPNAPAADPAAPNPAPAAPAVPPAGNEPAPAANPPAAPAEPDAAAMKAYLADKAKDVPLDGKTDADIAQMYKDLKAKETPVDPNAPAFKIPEEYKDRPWAAKIKSEADLFKQLDNLDKMVGKKGIPPDLSKATPEEREAFYAQLRPKDVSEYVFGEVSTLTPEIKTAVGSMLMKNGISAVQGNEIIKDYQALGEAQQAAMFDPATFTKTMEASFGKDYEKVTGHVYNTIKGMMSPEDANLIDKKLPNAYAALIYRTLGNVVQKFGVKETDTAHFNAPGSGGGTTDINQVRQGLRNEMGVMKQRPHTAQEYQVLVDKLAKTYQTHPATYGQ